MSTAPSRIPVRIEMRPMQPAPAPPGKTVPAPVRPHWSQVFADAIDHHVWRKAALDAFETHSFTGAPGGERWCTRCALGLAPDWKSPAHPVPPPCGDPSIRPVSAMNKYVWRDGICTIVPDPSHPPQLWPYGRAPEAKTHG